MTSGAPIFGVSGKRVQAPPAYKKGVFGVQNSRVTGGPCFKTCKAASNLIFNTRLINPDTD